MVLLIDSGTLVCANSRVGRRLCWKVVQDAGNPDAPLQPQSGLVNEQLRNKERSLQQGKANPESFKRLVCSEVDMEL